LSADEILGETSAVLLLIRWLSLSAGHVGWREALVHTC